MINSSAFEDSLSSMAAAERADMMEALLRGELRREDFETYLFNLKKIEYNEQQ